MVVSIPKDFVTTVLERKCGFNYRLGAVYLKFQNAKGNYVNTLMDQPDESAEVQAPNRSIRVCSSATVRRGFL